MHCYENCYTGSYQQVITVPPGGIKSLPMTCVTQWNHIDYEVCWDITDPTCSGSTPPIPCAYVVGYDPAGCSSYPPSDVMQYCKSCSPSTLGTVTVDGYQSQNSLHIHP